MFVFKTDAMRVKVKHTFMKVLIYKGGHYVMTETITEHLYILPIPQLT